MDFNSSIHSWHCVDNKNLIKTFCVCEKDCFVLLLFETEPNKFIFGGEIISFLVWKFLPKCILKN